MPSFDLLVAGEINPDLILFGDVAPSFGQAEKLVDSATLAVGSSSVIVACGAARLGLRVAFIGKCGRDVFGDFMRDEMAKRGVDINYLLVEPCGTTGISVILNRGADRAILTHPGLIGALRADEVTDDLLRQCRHLHVSSFFLQDALRPDLPGLFARAHANDLSTSLDTNYDPSEQWSGMDELLPVTDVFLPNETEACSLTHSGAVDHAAEILAGKVDTLAIKLGPRGTLGVSKGTWARTASIPVKVVDTIGAGDSFDAGFLYGYLNRWPLERSLRLATVCGALSTQATGGISAQPTLQQAMERMDKE